MVLLGGVETIRVGKMFRSKRSPDERSDIRVNIFALPAYRFAHAGYLLLAARRANRFVFGFMRCSQAVSNVAKSRARKHEFRQTIQSDLPCPVLTRKIFRYACRANHLYKLAPSRLDEGRTRRHGR
jgi:hypothetical protein